MLKAGGSAKLKASGLHPDMVKRRAIRSMFDGRYQFTRYFSPKQHNRPTTIDELFELNDLELFDHQTHPNEVENLAPDRLKNGGPQEPKEKGNWIRTVPGKGWFLFFRFYGRPRPISIRRGSSRISSSCRDAGIGCPVQPPGSRSLNRR